MSILFRSRTRANGGSRPSKLGVYASWTSQTFVKSSRWSGCLYDDRPLEQIRRSYPRVTSPLMRFLARAVGPALPPKVAGIQGGAVRCRVRIGVEKEAIMAGGCREARMSALPKLTAGATRRPRGDCATFIFQGVSTKLLVMVPRAGGVKERLTTRMAAILQDGGRGWPPRRRRRHASISELAKEMNAMPGSSE